MTQAPCTRLDFFLLNREQIIRWDTQRARAQVRYLIPVSAKPGNEMHAEHDGMCGTNMNCNANASVLPASPASVCLTDTAASICHCSHQPGPSRSIQYASTHSVNNTISRINITGIDSYKETNIQHLMSITPYNESASVSFNNTGSCDALPGVMYEYTYTTAQRFIDTNQLSGSFATCSGIGASNEVQPFPYKTYAFKPISDAMHISNYDELLLNVSTDEALIADRHTTVNSQECPENEEITLFQITSPSIDVAISTNTVAQASVPLLEDSTLDSLMWSAYGDPTLLDTHSAYEFSELMKHAEPITAPTEIYTPRRNYSNDPYTASPVTDNRWANNRALTAFTTLTPTSLYMPKYFKNRTLNVPAEIRLKKRLFHSRRMIRIVASNSQVVGVNGDNSVGALNSSRADSSIEAYQVLPVGTTKESFISRDAFILYCQDVVPSSWEEHDFPQNNVLSPFKTSLMSPLVPFAFNVPNDIEYRSVRVNRDTIQSPILRNSVLVDTPKVVILPESGTNTHARRFLVTPIQSSTPRKDPGSGAKSLNYHALSSNESSSERGISDAISDQSYDSIFVDTRKQTKFTKNSTGTPYNFSLKRAGKDLRDIPLPPTLKKS